MSEEINDVYNKIDELFKIKIKTHLKGTGLIFSKLLSVTDLLDQSNCYHLVVNNRVFAFTNTQELYEGLLKVLSVCNKENQSEIDYFEEHKIKDLNPDMFFIEGSLELLYDRDYKYKKLETRLNALLK